MKQEIQVIFHRNYGWFSCLSDVLSHMIMYNIEDIIKLQNRSAEMKEKYMTTGITTGINLCAVNMRYQV